MQNKYLWWMGGASALLLAGWYLHAQRGVDADPLTTAPSATTAPAPVSALGPAVAPAPTAPGAAEERSEDARPAWMGGDTATAHARGMPSSALPSGAMSREEEARAARMQAAMDRLQKLQTQKDVDPAEVDAALAEVERAHGSSVLQGVRLDVLRQNLRLAGRMQKAAEELQVLQQRSASGDAKPETQVALNKKLAEIEAMQRELRMDFYEGAPGTPARP